LMFATATQNTTYQLANSCTVYVECLKCFWWMPWYKNTLVHYIPSIHLPGTQHSLLATFASRRMCATFSHRRLQSVSGSRLLETRYSTTRQIFQHYSKDPETWYLLSKLSLYKKFLGFLDFSVQLRLDPKFPPRKNILYTIHSLSEHFCKI